MWEHPLPEILVIGCCRVKRPCMVLSAPPTREAETFFNATPLHFALCAGVVSEYVMYFVYAVSAEVF